MPASDKKLPNGIVLPDTWPPRGPATTMSVPPSILISGMSSGRLSRGAATFTAKPVPSRLTMQIWL